MKNVFLLLIFSFLLSVALLAQVVPNGGFESWTNGNPDNWYADNIPTVAVPVTPSTAHSGNFSAKGTVINTFGGLLTPLLQTDLGVQGFAVSQRYKTVTGFYQFNPVQGDKLKLDFILFSGGGVIAEVTPEITATAASWTQFNIDFVYSSNDIPDKCFLQFMIDGPATSGDYHEGSYFILDDLNLTGINTSVNDKNIIPAKFSLEQNYPNPFNPSTIIQYNLPQNSFVNLKVYNIIGKEVASLVNSVVPAGSHEVVFDASMLNSGVYFYTLKTGNNFVQTKKMILMK
jgi:hypothetical protein